MKAIVPIGKFAFMWQRFGGHPVGDAPSQLRAWLAADLGPLKHEELILLLFNGDGKILGEVRTIGERDHVHADLAEIVRTAVVFGARVVVAAHNHPSGKVEPSEADVTMTRRIVQAAIGVGIILHDHWIFAGEQCFSFRDEGLI